MKHALALGALCLTCLNAPAAAAALCLEPRAPSVLFLSKPSKPYCATSRSCEQWQVDSYKRDVARYYARLEEYLEEVDRFRKRAVEYAQCMADLD